MNTIGRYVIISELGRGAMGIVYRASDPTIDREVALKVVSLNASTEDGSESPRQMFMREVRAAGRLTHSSIVTIHDAFDDPETQTSCIVMELVPGRTLEKILDSGHSLSVEQILQLVRQVAEGLDFAHRNHVIHRDLKPANILVSEDGIAKITDFGIAKVLARDGAARTLGVMGTPSYMSPEQVKGADVDARTDLFSLGIVFFAMLTGKRPFVGNTATVMFKIVYDEPPAPSTFDPRLTPAYDYVVQRCLAKDRKNRYGSARELVGDLDDLQNGRPPRSQTAPSVSAPAELASANKTVQTPVPGAVKTTSPRSAGPPPPSVGPAARPPAPAPQVRGPVAAAPPRPTVAAPLPGPQPPAPPQRSAGPPPLPAAAKPEIAGTPPATMAMPISELLKAASQPPAPRSMPPAAASSAGPPTPTPPPLSPPQQSSLSGQTLPMHVPDLSSVTSAFPAPPAPKASAHDEPPLMERTLPMRVPDLSALSLFPPSPPRPVSESAPARPPMDKTVPMQTPDFPGLSSPPPPAVPTPLAPPHSPPTRRTTPNAPPEVSPAPQGGGPPPPVPFASPPAGVQPEEPTMVSAAPPAASKAKLLPALVGGLAVALLTVVVWGYWRFHRARTAPAPQVAAQTQAAPPPQLPAPVTTPPPPPVTTVEAAPPAKAAPHLAKKSSARKTTQVVEAQPVPAAPTPAPAAAPPVAVTPAPAPTAPPPSPEAIARAEAAKYASVAHIVNVSCNYGLKEATFTFSSGGATLFQQTVKGKKKKEGFLGIKGSYQGTFTRTLTVPAGASDVSVHVVARDGADLRKAINMPSPGGFVPTLVVNADSEHLSLNWKGGSAAF